MKLQNPFIVGLIPNHPEIRMNTFTQTIERNSINVRVAALRGAMLKSAKLGCPNVWKSACTTRTRNIAVILSNSKLDCRGPVVIDEMASFIYRENN